MRSLWFVLPAVTLVTVGLACGGSGSGSGGSGGSKTSGMGGGGGPTSSMSDTGGISLAGTGQGGAGGGRSCVPPDVMIALDRTLSMHFTPNGETPTDGPEYKSSKWFQALDAIETLTKAPADKTIRFGLELWPPDPGEGCITLAERIADSPQATNPQCQDGEVVVEPALNTGAAIDAKLDPATTKLCISTPTGQALQVALDDLQATKEPGREQYVVLVTDGADWDFSCPDPDPIAVVQQLATAGLKTYVVGFFGDDAADSGSGTGRAFLNDMACAGQTAKGFPAPCTKANGVWTATNPAGADVFLHAGSGGELGDALHKVAGEICCGCVK